MVKRFILIIIWIGSSSVIENNEARPIFGVNVSYQSTGQFTTYMVYLDNGITKSNKKILTENEFIHIASGKWPSIYNPKRINYFEKNGLNCGVLKDEITFKDYSYCNSMDSLWKLRFEKHPFDITKGNGWSHRKFRPTIGQEQYLFKTFGIKQIDGDYFLDSNFWNLLHDVQDPEWIKNYKSLY
jgi:hypothetical protein